MSRPTTDSNRKPKYDIYDIRPVFDLKMYMENKTYLNDIFYILQKLRMVLKTVYILNSG